MGAWRWSKWFNITTQYTCVTALWVQLMPKVSITVVVTIKKVKIMMKNRKIKQRYVV